MNKLFLFLAVFAIAFFSACSDEKEATHEDLCAKGITVECLVGEWNLDNVAGCSNYRGSLSLSKDLKYDFIRSKTANEDEDGDGGDWRLDGTTIILNSMLYGEKKGTVVLEQQGREMTVTSLDAGYTFSNCTSGNSKVEKFTYRQQ